MILKRNIPVENIVYHGPEPDFDYLDQYAESIKKHKPPPPLLDVRKVGEGKYELIWKIQTLRAYIQAGFTTVNIVIHDLTDEQVKIHQTLASWEYMPREKLKE